MLALPASPGALAEAPPPVPNVEEFLRQGEALREQADFRTASASDRIVARFSSRARAAADARRRGARILADVDGRGTVVLGLPKRARPAPFARRVQAGGAIWAEPDRVRRAFQQKTEWGVEALRAPEARLTNGATGAGVVVAVVDSGVDYTHEDLDANIWANPGETGSGRETNGVDDDGNGFVDDFRGYDFIGTIFTSPQPDNDPMDVIEHGTHVAGIVAAEDNSVGVVGVAPRATIMPVRVLDDIGVAFDSQIAQGIRYAADNGADIVNISLGGYIRSSTLREAVEYAGDNGVAVVAAAGNAFFYSLPSYPAAYPSVISVSAAREVDLAKTWWSDWGHVDFLAPGDLILSSTLDNTYQRFSGTSMASPHVAGVLALAKQIHPGFTPAQLEQAVAATAVDAHLPGIDEVSGAGFPDARAATGALPARSVHLARSDYLIPADGETESTITLSVRDAAGGPVGGVTGTFSTDLGSLSRTTFTTDASGQATTDLVADDAYGSAMVTATPVALAAASIRVIVEDDRIRVDDVHVVREGGGGGKERFVEFGAYNGVEPPEDDLFFEQESPLEILPGDKVTITAFLGAHDFSFDSRRVAFAYQVTDPDGDRVRALSGELEPITHFGFGGQQTASTLPLKIPGGAPRGWYTIAGTARTLETGETHTLEKTFRVGKRRAQVLLVQGTQSFDAETFNFLSLHTTDPVVRRALERLGVTVDTWPMDSFFEPTPRELRKYATVIWLGGWDFLPMRTVKRHLERGGNILVSGEQYGTNARQAGRLSYRTFLHAMGLLTTFFPDDNNQITPSTIAGSPDGPFEGVTFDTDTYDLSASGETTAIVTDELLLNDDDGATELFRYASGLYDPAIAGVQVDTGEYRAVNLGFGVEAIDDAGDATLASVLEWILDAFNPPPDITGIFPRRVPQGQYFFIAGENFQRTGRTEVYLDDELIGNATVDARTSISVRVPRSLDPGRYRLRVVNPDGSVARAMNPIRVTVAPPEVFFVSPDFASNDRARMVRIDGVSFRPGADVRIGGEPVPSERLDRWTLKARLPAGFRPLGSLDVVVINPDGRRGVLPGGLWVRYGFTFDFGPGTSHAAVAHLQRRLKRYGFYPDGAEITRSYGSLTDRAVRRYQRDRDLDVTGTVNAATRRKLNERR